MHIFLVLRYQPLKSRFVFDYCVEIRPDLSNVASAAPDQACLPGLFSVASFAYSINLRLRQWNPLEGAT